MPFDQRDLPATRSLTRRAADRRLVAGWLFCMCGMIWVMVMLGGATRLTGSGLSIMEWAPLSGALPPLSHAAWEKLFALYKQIPQYTLVNQGFGLAGFQHIFWLEWTHRLWGRLIGIAFLVPLLVLWARGAIERRLVPRLVLLFVLGGLQGAVGWFMVASGFLRDSTAVAPARLVVHLLLALALYSAILWTGLSVLRPAPVALPGASWLRRGAALLCILVALTITAGGFVAGTHAGFIYNTFPLMAGRLVPVGPAALDPFAAGWLHDLAAVQFDHRALASLTALTAVALVWAGLRARLPRVQRRTLVVLAAAVAAQYALGVATLLLVVPVPVATAHQGMAVLLLTAALTLLHALRGARAPARLPAMETFT